MAERVRYYSALFGAKETTRMVECRHNSGSSSSSDAGESSSSVASVSSIHSSETVKCTPKNLSPTSHKTTRHSSLKPYLLLSALVGTETIWRLHERLTAQRVKPETCLKVVSDLVLALFSDHCCKVSPRHTTPGELCSYLLSSCRGLKVPPAIAKSITNKVVNHVHAELNAVMCDPAQVIALTRSKIERLQTLTLASTATSDVLGRAGRSFLSPTWKGLAYSECCKVLRLLSVAK
eukprot:Sspe_Gene.90703::Locus_62200_Transcript_1_1_Confidence_1.000_Length_757::g.90703::m.90703